MKQSWFLTGTIFAAVSMSGCGNSPQGSEESKAFYCASFAASGGTLSSNASLDCAGCTVTNKQSALDADSTTAATIEAPASNGGGISFRATAGPGIVFPGGTFAGILGDITLTGTISSIAFSFRTYLDGNLQEENGSDSKVAEPNVGALGNTGQIPMGVQTTKPFNAVEFSISGQFAGISSDVYEFCSDMR